MSESIKTQIRQLQNLLNQQNRFIDFACQYVQYEKVNGKPITTGKRSKIYGGVYDIYTQTYTDKTPTNILQLPCYGNQFEFITDNYFHQELTGGRGSGKSVAGSLRFIRFICELSKETGFIVSATYEHCKRVRERIIDRIPREWIYEDVWLPQNKHLILMNGFTIRYKTSQQEKALRSDSGSIAFIDETQLLKTTDIDAFIPCLRDGKPPRYWECGTIKLGDFEERHKRALENEKKGKSKTYTILPLDNPYISDDILELEINNMSEHQYKIEILSDWTALETEDKPKVFPVIGPKHLINMSQFAGKDMTRFRTLQKFNTSCDYIVGVDYNNTYPNTAVICKIYQPDLLIVVDQIYQNGHAGHLVEALKKKGYLPSNSLIIDDKSGRNKSIYDNQKAPSMRIKNAGYTVVGCSKGDKNPRIEDTVDAVLLKLDPIKEEPTLLISTKCAGKDIFSDSKDRKFNGIYDDLMELSWKTDGTLYKPQNRDITHSCDCLRYITYAFYPPKRSSRKVKLFDATGKFISV